MIFETITFSFEDAEQQRRFHDELERKPGRVAVLEAALRPFAEAYRFIQPMGAMRREYEASMACTGKFTAQDLARAAELIPPQGA